MGDRTADATIDRILTTFARDHAGIARALARIDPTLGSEVVEVADGLLVLGGPGTYINAAVACERTAPLTEEDWATIVEHSAAVGVTPAIELSATTHPGTVAGAAEHGFELDTTRDAYLLLLDGVPPPAELVDGVEIIEIDEASRALWQQAAAIGFGHDEPGPRAISDRWAHAALLAGDRMFVALAAGRPVASAILHVTDGVATVGGMSTVPSARGRGIQAAMLRHRIRLASRAGCDVVVSTAMSPGSARNLVRAGFAHVFTIETWERPS